MKSLILSALVETVQSSKTNPTTVRTLKKQIIRISFMATPNLFTCLASASDTAIT